MEPRVHLHTRPCLTCISSEPSSKLLEGGYIGHYTGDYEVTTIELIKGDTRSLEYGSSKYIRVALSSCRNKAKCQGLGFKVYG